MKKCAAFFIHKYFSKNDCIKFFTRDNANKQTFSHRDFIFHFEKVLRSNLSTNLSSHHADKEKGKDKGKGKERKIVKKTARRIAKKLPKEGLFGEKE